MSDATTPAAVDAPTGSVDLSGDGGVLKVLTADGTGELRPGDGCTVSCHYTGTLADGTQFDSSIGREPFSFELGKESVVKGFELAAASMRKGERATFTFQPQYGYGARGSPPAIPANAVLTFAMEMLDWTPPDCSPNRDGGIERHVLVKPAKPNKTPTEGATVTVDVIGVHDGRTFDERRGVELQLGFTPSSVLIDGVQLALLQFGRGETSRLVIRPEYAFGPDGGSPAEFGVPADATVEYTVTLHAFQNEKQSWTLDEAESVAEAKQSKERATELFRAGDFKLALKLYEKSNSFLSSVPMDSNTEARELKVSVFLNIALCNQKLGDTVAVKSACNSVLELDADNVKAHYRRGQSLVETGELEQAIVDFQRVLQIDERNGAAAQQIARVQKLQKDAYEKDKKLYRNMFSKFASKDNEKDESDRNADADVLSSCGEWNMEEAARMEANLAFQEVDENVVMI